MTEQPLLSGNMLLFERPELLTREDHAHLGLSKATQPFSFCREVRAVPLMVSEFRTAQRHCPIVFSDLDQPVPVAVLGVLDPINLFVDKAGRWQVPGYVPAYLRCYPFALATATTDRFALVFDRAADMVSDQPEVPFFDGDELSDEVQKRLEFCRSYQAEQKRTDAFCQMLKRFDLLAHQQVTYAQDDQEQSISSHFGIDRDKLMALDKEAVDQLFRDGSLGAITAHLFSLDNFDELMRMRQRWGKG